MFGWRYLRSIRISGLNECRLESVSEVGLGVHRSQSGGECMDPDPVSEGRNWEEGPRPYASGCIFVSPTAFIGWLDIDFEQWKPLRAPYM